MLIYIFIGIGIIAVAVMILAMCKTAAAADELSQIEEKKYFNKVNINYENDENTEENIDEMV